jgi:hypothetical protein
MDIEDFLHELDGWERAYPLSAFPEPDLRKAAELLKAGGMTLDAISASNMRHVVSQIAPKARATIESLQAEVERRDAALEKVKDRCFSSDEGNWAHDILSIVVPILDGQALAAKGETREVLCVKDLTDEDLDAIINARASDNDRR